MIYLQEMAVTINHNSLCAALTWIKRQTAVTVYFSMNQLLLFAFAIRYPLFEHTDDTA